MQNQTPTLNPKQNEYILNANKRWNFKIGAVRSGKSYCDVAYVILARLRAVKDEPGLNCILGVSRETIESNVLQPMREIYTSAVVGQINSRNIAMIAGVPVYCLGAEKISQVSKLQGKSIKYCYGDEVAKWSGEVFMMLKSRLDKAYSKFDGSCNPEGKMHWLKLFLDDEQLDIYVQKYTIFDNPALPKSFVTNICHEYSGTVYYDRFILGEWVNAEGLVYPMFDETKHVTTQEFDFKPAYYVSCDYGTQNPTVFLLWHKIQDGRWLCEKEYYYSGRKEIKQKTDEEYCDDLIKFLDGIHISGIIVDPSAASFIAALRKRGFVVIAAKNAVIDGIRFTSGLINRGLLLFRPCCKSTIQEFSVYSWDPDTEEDEVIKKDDHAMDAMRYFAYTHLAIPKIGTLKLRG
jgi:PBSX family phage terminase large subunit